MPETREESADPRAHLREIWRHRWLLMTVVVLIPAGVYVITSLAPKTYEASATLEARSITAAQTDAEIVGTRDFAAKAARRLGEGEDQAGELDDSTTTAVVQAGTGSQARGSPLFTVTASDGGRDRAAEIANAFADAYSKQRRNDTKDRIEQTRELLTATQDQEDALTRQLQTLQDTLTQSPVVERASPPNAPTSPEPLRNTAVALVFSLLLAGGIVVVFAAFDRAVRDPAAVENLTGAPLLGTVPRVVFSSDHPSLTASETFQTLRSSLTYLNRDRSLDSVVVASPSEAEGNTTVATNLAIAFAEADQQVILLDADLRRSPIASRLGVEPRYGVEDVLVHGRDLDEVLNEFEIDTEAGRLRVLTGGAPPANPSALVTSPAMRSLLDELVRRTDVVIVDTPPLLAVGDALPLIASGSGTVLVARLGRTRRDAVTRARELIERSGGRILGAVATGTHLGPFQSGVYRHGYGTDREDAEVGTRENARKTVNPVLRAYHQIRSRLSGIGE